MPLCYISIGSNINREHNIASALKVLQKLYSGLTYSSIYESAAVGFSGSAFYNLVIAFQTDQEPVIIARQLKSIEADHHRVPGQEKFSSRTLDLDLLLYDQQIISSNNLNIPHDDILNYAFVLEPLAEIAPNQHHPINDVCYQKLWQDFDKNKVQQEKVDRALLNTYEYPPIAHKP